MEQSQKFDGKPETLEKFISEHLARGSQPPKDWETQREKGKYNDYNLNSLNRQFQKKPLLDLNLENDMLPASTTNKNKRLSGENVTSSSYSSKKPKLDLKIFDLFRTLVTMFPDTSTEYLKEQAEKLSNKPEDLDNFISEHLSRNSQPPQNWQPKKEAKVDEDNIHAPAHKIQLNDSNLENIEDIGMSNFLVQNFTTRWCMIANQLIVYFFQPQWLPLKCH